MHVQDQTHLTLAQVEAVETGFRIKVRNESQEDKESRESETPASLGPHSDSGVAGLMRGRRRSMRFSGT